MNRKNLKGIFISILFILFMNFSSQAQFPHNIDIIILVDVSGSMEFSLTGAYPTSPSTQRIYYVKPGLTALSTVFEKLELPTSGNGGGVNQVRFAIGRFPGLVPTGGSLPYDFSWLEKNGDSNLRLYRNNITPFNELHDIINNELNVTWKGTPLGTAVIDAIIMLNDPINDLPSSITTEEIILLFTDGRKRGGEPIYKDSNPSTAEYEEFPSGSGISNVRETEISNHIDQKDISTDDLHNIKIISLGFGDYTSANAETDWDLLSDISNQGPFVYDPAEPSANFTKDLVYAAFNGMGYPLLVDPDYLINPADIQEHSYYVTEFDEKLIFMVSWHEPRIDSTIQFTMKTPSNLIINSSLAEENSQIEYDEGETFQMYTVYKSFFDDNKGEWKILVNGNDIQNSEWYAYTVIGLSSLKLKEVTSNIYKPKYTGDSLQLDISLAADRNPIHDAIVRAKLTYSEKGSGNWFAEFPLTPLQIDSVKNIHFPGYVEDFYKKYLYMHHIKNIPNPDIITKEIILTYNSEDSLYHGKTSALTHPDIYKIEVFAKNNPENNDNFFERDLVKNFHINVKPNLDWTFSCLEFEKLSIDEENSIDIYKAKFTPKDQYSNYVKPGNEDKIKFQVENATLSKKPIIDDLQGSYYKEVKVPQNSLQPTVKVQFGNFVFEDRIITDDPVRENWRINLNAFSLHIGSVLPSGSTQKLYNGGIHASIDLYRQLSKHWALNAIIGYSNFENKITKKKLDYWNLSANIRWFPVVNPSYRLFLNGGSGLYVADQNSNSNAGYNIGAGSNIPLSSYFDFELGIDYHNIFLNEDDFKFIRIYGGVLFRF